jgi:hypothetical protein
MYWEEPKPVKLAIAAQNIGYKAVDVICRVKP